MAIHQLSAETSYVIDPLAPRLSATGVDILIEKYDASSRKRHRFCFHQNPSVELHDIVICYDKESYIPPNKHVGKAESLLVLQGIIDLFLFSDSGQVYDYRRLSTSDSEHPFYVRIPPNTWHGLRSVGEGPAVIKETISGPYDRTTLHWAGFAPSEADGTLKGLDWYDFIELECTRIGINPPEDETFEKVTDTVYRSTRQLITVKSSQLLPMINSALETPLKRARLCCHAGPEDKLQEMFIALAKGVDIEESMHLRKDESLTVISGSGIYQFPNEDGTLRDSLSLASFDQKASLDSNFFARINRYVPHKILVCSEILLIHEATTGPFLKTDTDYRLPRIDE